MHIDEFEDRPQTADEILDDLEERGINVFLGPEPHQIVGNPKNKITLQDRRNIAAARDQILWALKTTRLPWQRLERRAETIADDHSRAYLQSFAHAYEQHFSTSDEVVDRWKYMLDRSDQYTDASFEFVLGIRTEIERHQGQLHRAIDLGWSERELLGIHPRAGRLRPDCEGLLAAIVSCGYDCRISRVTAEYATIRPRGLKSVRHYRRISSEAVPAWAAI